MKVNFDKVLVNIDGVELLAADDKPATLRGVVVDALLAVFQDEQHLSGEEKLKRYLLAEKVFKGASDVGIEDVTLIKKLIGKAFNPLIVGQTWQILEGNENDFKE
jgi:DUF1365 family protein